MDEDSRNKKPEAGARRRAGRAEVIELELEGSVENLELDLPAAVPVEASSSAPRVDAEEALALEDRAAPGTTDAGPPAEASRRGASQRQAAIVVPPERALPRSRPEPRARFDAPPTVTFYTPTYFVLMLGAGATFFLLGITQLPGVCELFGQRYGFLGVRNAVMALGLGAALLVGAARYRRSRGESDETLSTRQFALVALLPIVLVLVAFKIRGNAPPPGSGAPAVLFQPSFRRGYLDQLRAVYSDASIDLTAPPGKDPSQAGATLRFRVRSCSQAFVDGMAENPGSQALLRRAGLARVACENGDPTQPEAFESAPF